jgi:hypothetical protein
MGLLSGFTIRRQQPIVAGMHKVLVSSRHGISGVPVRQIAIVLFALLVAGAGYRYLGPSGLPARPDIRTTELQALVDRSARTILPTIVLHPAETRQEPYWAAALTAAMHGRQEVKINHGRIDVLSATYAIEVDWLDKWHEGLGQALHYSIATGKAPAVALIIKPSEWPLNANDISKLNEIRMVAEKLGVEVILLRAEAER